MVVDLTIKSCINKSNLSFLGKPDSSPAEKFINDVNKTIETQEKGNFISRYMWSPTATVLSVTPLLGFELYSLIKFKKLSKTGDKAGKAAFRNKFAKATPLLIGAGVVILGGLEYLFSRNSKEKCEKFRQDFLDINTTEAKLRDKMIRASYIGATCSPVAEEVTINKNLILDPVTNRRLKKLVKHELVHAKQYETIARSENGIKKLNYAILKSVAKNMNNPIAKAEIIDIYNDIIHDESGKFDNYILHISGADVDLKKYIEGIHTVLLHPDTDAEGLPIVLDEEHYKKVISKSGPLTKEEETKAEKYYQALLNYPQLTFWNMINPFSPYYNNLLEREAYRENPNLMVYIRLLFGKG